MFYVALGSSKTLFWTGDCGRIPITLIPHDVPIASIRKEPCGGWMIVLFVVMSFNIGYVDLICQSFLSGCVVFSNHSFWLCCYRFLTFPCLWEKSFSGQMISVTVSWLLGFDRIFK